MEVELKEKLDELERAYVNLQLSILRLSNEVRYEQMELRVMRGDWVLPDNWDFMITSKVKGE